MSFCSKCGKQLNEYSIFCPYCGNDVQQYEEKKEVSNSTVIFKYQKSVWFTFLIDPLTIILDDSIKIKVIDGKDVIYNIPQGNHKLSAYIPYLAGSRYGEVTKQFSIGVNEVLEIVYKPPMTWLSNGNISIKIIK